LITNKERFKMALSDRQQSSFASGNPDIKKALTEANTTTTTLPNPRPKSFELNSQNKNGMDTTIAKSVSSNSTQEALISTLLGSKALVYNSGVDNPILYNQNLGKELANVLSKTPTTPDDYYEALNSIMMGSNSTLSLSTPAKQAADAFMIERTPDQITAIQEFLGVTADGDLGKETRIAIANYKNVFGEEKLLAKFPYPASLQATGVRSVRNNNPGNIDRNKIKWEGMADDQKSDSRFVVFKTPELGARAMAKVLRNYQTRYNLNTVSGIISRWAPPSENNTKSYTATVAKAAGVTINQTIDIVNDKTLLSKIMTAMIKVEGGNDAVKHFTPDVIKAGIELIVEPNNTGLRPKPRPANLKVGVAP
tara:strand:+ start:316 stop:1413 length:1098 start_codon:yes stop_codon:yes gene_type:complete